jgi:hypothetical protein
MAETTYTLGFHVRNRPILYLGGFIRMLGEWMALKGLEIVITPAASLPPEPPPNREIMKGV